jgi:hypothetical protein
MRSRITYIGYADRCMVETSNPEFERVDAKKGYIHCYYPKLHKIAYSNFESNQPDLVRFADILERITYYLHDDWEENCVLIVRTPYLSECVRSTQRVLVSVM